MPSKIEVPIPSFATEQPIIDQSTVEGRLDDRIRRERARLRDLLEGRKVLEQMIEEQKEKVTMLEGIEKG